jgi:oligoribonuclease NrnB/cAMP/cGMP phosphodiesterase (DHH superfamily)
MNALVLYHRDWDGLVAAWVAKRAWEGRPFKLSNDTFEAISVQYGEPVPDAARSADRVYILDFSYPRDVLLKLRDEVDNLYVIDHHRAAKKDLEGLDPSWCMFSEKYSGAYMAWNYFNEDHMGRAPRLVDCVEDHDLWRFRMLASKEIRAVIGSYPQTFEACDELNVSLWESPVHLVEEGAAILRYQEREIEAAVANAYPIAYPIALGSVLGLAVNCSTAGIISEVAGRLAVKSGTFGACWFHVPAGHWVVEVRSRGDLDVSELANRFGGGGHKNGVGFQISQDGYYRPPGFR